MSITGARLAGHAVAVLARADGSEAAVLDEIAVRQRTADEERKAEAEREQAGGVVLRWRGFSSTEASAIDGVAC